MRTALLPLAARFGAEVTDVDVDAHPDLEAAYGDLVPVLYAGEPAAANELSRYTLDASRVIAALAPK